MKHIILLLSVALLSCQKEASPAEQILGTWFIVGIEDESGFTPQTKKKAYTFYDYGKYEYFLSVNTVTHSYRVDGNHFFIGENPNYFLIELTDSRLKIANATGDSPAYYRVFER